jgi:hypothetical protein
MRVNLARASLSALRVILTVALVLALGEQEALAEPATTPAAQASATVATPSTEAQSPTVAAPPSNDAAQAAAPHHDLPPTGARRDGGSPRDLAARNGPSTTAANASPPPAPQSASPRRWYGWQTLLTDAAALALGWPGVSTASESRVSGAVVVMTGATYLLGGPVVHVAHGNMGTGVGSLALRGAPLALMAPAYLGCNGIECAFPFLLGGWLGIVAAVTLDAAVLAYDEPKDAAPKYAATRPRFTPTFALVPESGRLMPSVGLGGTF